MSEPKSPRSSVAERWALPSVEGPIVGVRRDPRSREAEANRATDAARKAEMDRGYQAGMTAARNELKSQTDALSARVARLDEILNQLSRPLPELEAEVEEQLVLLALAVGKQLARRELKADPGQIAALIREAVGSLPAAAREVRVHLHPEDASAIAERLATAGQERAWSVVEDPTLTRGGCLVRSENSQIDARFESRVNAMISAMLGEERASHRAPEAPDAANEVADGGAEPAP